MILLTTLPFNDLPMTVMAVCLSNICHVCSFASSQVLLNIANNEMVIGVALTEESLHRRNITHFGPTTLRSTLAYGMLRSSALPRAPMHTCCFMSIIVKSFTLWPSNPANVCFVEKMCLISVASTQAVSTPGVWRHYRSNVWNWSNTSGGRVGQLVDIWFLIQFYLII